MNRRAGAPRRPIIVSTIFSSVPYAQNENSRACNFVAHFISAYQDAPDVARLEFFKSFPDARMLKELRRSG